MVIVYLVASFIGSVVAVVAAWPWLGWTAFTVAPLGGSTLVLVIGAYLAIAIPEEARSC